MLVHTISDTGNIIILFGCPIYAALNVWDGRSRGVMEESAGVMAES